MTSRTIFGRVFNSREPAPWPIFSIVIAGIVPKVLAKVVKIAAAVGVKSSICSGPPNVGIFLTSSAVAGAGTGRIPCSVLTVPPPTASGLQQTFSILRASMPIHADNYIDNRINRPDFVKMNARCLGAMDMGFGLGKLFKYFNGPGFYRITYTAVFNYFYDIAQMPVVMLGWGCRFKSQGFYSAACRLRDFEFEIFDTQARKLLP